MFRPHFTSGNGLFGKNNNTGTYIDQRGRSLAATHLGWMINGSCFVGINLRRTTSEGFLVMISGTSGKGRQQKKTHLIRHDLSVFVFTYSESKR